MHFSFLIFRQSSYVHLKIGVYNPKVLNNMLTWYVMTKGSTKDSRGLHVLYMNCKMWAHFKCACRYGMACCQGADGEDSFQVWRVAALY
jgi:hypothetical protein